MSGLKNCPVTQEDIKMAEKTFVPEVSTLKGKTTDEPGPLAVNDHIEAPAELREAHKNIELCADIFHVEGVMFLLDAFQLTLDQSSAGERFFFFVQNT